MKKYILKPGNHQFAPGSPAVHNNDNLTDEEAEWYLQKYPHITGLFVANPQEVKPKSSEEAKSRKLKAKRKRIAPAKQSVLIGEINPQNRCNQKI
ncbi:hypothetical protein [Mucilaginibacter psychrotolerans]|uniref:Uncharacterized protein n=1 Tax=Mucilaginibacter psychrotolerans TaxID=1524096 RepID=A0A4Y8S419_9SPHI|nr:hypothetical protein [Mucilaginibacter psychrotolerans]TFF32171.1 hypothetical protein E2R66_26970 [Mucilaginibacter psychrotolerans]